MEKINWAQKLGSRKLWALIGALVVALGTLFGLDTHFVTQIVTVVMAFGSIITYLLVEGHIDATRIDAQSDCTTTADSIDPDQLANALADHIENALTDLNIGK